MYAVSLYDNSTLAGTCFPTSVISFNVLRCLLYVYIHTSVSSLRFTSLLAICCTVFLCIVVVVQYFVQIGHGEIQPFWSPNCTIALSELFVPQVGSLAKAFSIIVYSYTCHPNVLPIYLELQRRSSRRM